MKKVEHGSLSPAIWNRKERSASKKLSVKPGMVRIYRVWCDQLVVILTKVATFPAPDGDSVLLLVALVRLNVGVGAIVHLLDGRHDLGTPASIWRHKRCCHQTSFHLALRGKLVLVQCSREWRQLDDERHVCGVRRKTAFRPENYRLWLLRSDLCSIVRPFSQCRFRLESRSCCKEVFARKV